ncbi:hypothetical protein [uncultured Alsobacter sp.]|uniref:hypothetical protein n=1 Tax=uncultured Alsobacter sp. TaxID=1748258 RepID=UPI0025D59D91|nr:hypothetical protein [uncultured Alsobacter sp.]
MTTTKERRKAIPTVVKLQVVLAQDGKCRACGERLGDLAGLNFDHRPPLVSRPWLAETCDYDPPQNDPAHIEALHVDCHAARTFGPGGEKRITTRGGDIHEYRRADRISNKHAEFQRRLLEPDQPDPAPRKKAKRKIPSRPFPSRRKEKRTS